MISRGIVLILLLAVLPGFPSSLTDSYTLTPGDRLLFDLSSDDRPPVEVVVGESGSAIFPIIGAVRVEGKRISELKRMLEKKYAEYYYSPVVSIVLVKANLKVVILGAAARPGVYEWRPGMTVSELLAEAGGIAVVRAGERAYPQGSMDEVLIIRNGRTERALPGARLIPGDTVFVPWNSTRKVYVIGEVKRPGEVFLTTRRMHVLDAIACAGGVTGDRGRWIYVVRRDGSVEVYSVPDVLLKREGGCLTGGEVILVSSSRLTRTSDVFRKIGEIFTAIGRALFVMGRF